MIINSATIAFRHLKKNKQYTLLNVFGLSVGLACFILIGLWVKTELSFDRFHANANRIFRVGSTLMDETAGTQQAVTGPPLAIAMMKDFPEVSDAVRIDPSDATVRIDGHTFVEDNILVTESSFFNIFDFRLLKGDRKTALSEPYSIVLSESLAKKYFLDSDPVGKLIRVFRYDPDGTGSEFKVTGVIEDAPHNSHITYHALISFKTWETVRPEINGPGGWFNNVVHTYVLLNKDASADALEAKLHTLVTSYMSDGGYGKPAQRFFLQKITDIHLFSRLMFDFGPNGSMTHVIIFGSVGLVVLLLAGINYVNLATAYATQRYKEIGIQKVMGARQRQLVLQYLVEAWILCMLSLLIAICWVELARPLFQSMTGSDIFGLYEWQTVITIFGLATFVGIAAGFYPSVMLSNFHAINMMKGGHGGLSGVLVRKILVVAQYSLTTILIVGIVVIQFQLKYVRERDLGFDQEQIVVFGVHGSPEVLTGYDVFANELMRSNKVSGVTRSNTTMGGGLGNSLAYVQNADGKHVSTTAYRLRIDHAYLDVYGIHLVAGRGLIPGNPADSSGAFIVNETMTKQMGFRYPAEALDRPLELDGIKGKIIGVTKDFHYDGLHQKIEPMCMWLLRVGYSRISIRIKGDLQESFSDVTAMWKAHFPNSPMQYRFMEDSLSGEYESDKRFSKVFLVFSAVSLAIACLGLFALVSYSVQRRAKEIGIRKVLGASVASILSLASREFIILVAAGLAIAMPVGYYLMEQWLMNFAYHITLEFWMFAAAAATVLVVAWATVGYRSVIAASANPSDTLRSE